MKKLWQRKVNFLVMGVVLLVYACSGNIQEKKMENPGAKFRLLIAVIEGRASEFKEAVIQQMIEKYKDTCAIDVLNVSQTEQITQKQYDVVLLIDRCKWGMKFNSTFKKLAAELDQKKLVVFITAGDADWKYSDNGIDAVTSASKNGKEQDVVQEIAKKIDAVLNK
jgi:flavodoxin